VTVAEVFEHLCIVETRIERVFTAKPTEARAGRAVHIRPRQRRPRSRWRRSSAPGPGSDQLVSVDRVRRRSRSEARGPGDWAAW